MKLTKNGYSKYVCVSKDAQRMQGIDEQTNLYYVPPEANPLGFKYLVYSLEGNQEEPLVELSASAQNILQIMAEYRKKRMSKANIFTAFVRTYPKTKAKEMIEAGIIELINQKKITLDSATDLYVELV